LFLPELVVISRAIMDIVYTGWGFGESTVLCPMAASADRMRLGRSKIYFAER
jgi:hypothetical protein